MCIRRCIIYLGSGARRGEWHLEMSADPILPLSQNSGLDSKCPRTAERAIERDRFLIASTPSLALKSTRDQLYILTSPTTLFPRPLSHPGLTVKVRLFPLRMFGRYDKLWRSLASDRGRGSRPPSGTSFTTPGRAQLNHNPLFLFICVTNW